MIYKYNKERKSLKLTEKSIGKSDGRCVQKAGTYSGWFVEPDPYKAFLVETETNN